MKIDQDTRITVIDEPTFCYNELVKKINSTTEDPFYVMDVGDLIRKYENWTLKLPNIKPFYAVKCNDSPVVLRLLASLGANFDCASKGEISKVLEIEGVGPENIIYANPAKQSSHIKYAARVGVDLMTFDNSLELQKIKACHPQAKLILRIRCDASVSTCPLGAKFGCDPASAVDLLLAASALNLAVVGVSFHVGSGCQEPEAYYRALRATRRVFDDAWSLGFNLTIVDIGGGFLGDTVDDINPIVDVLNEAIPDLFGDLEGIEFIAEPGRYFVASAYTLATTVHSKREVEGKPVMYYINDGVYGSFNCILYDHAAPLPVPLDVTGELKESSIWGPTCDSLDIVSESLMLPPLQVGNVLVFQNMGAYTLPAASPFNGYPVPVVHHFISSVYMKQLENVLRNCSNKLSASFSSVTSCSKHSNTTLNNINNIFDLLTLDVEA